MKLPALVMIIILWTAPALGFTASVTWLASDKRIDSDAGSDSSPCQIAASGSNVYVVWEDTRNSNSTSWFYKNSDIYYNYSNDYGRTWQPHDIRLNTNTAGSKRCLRPQIAADGNKVFVTWYDNRNGYTDIFFNYSVNGGRTWLASERRLDTDAAGSHYSNNPKIAVSGNYVYVLWSDLRNSGGSNHDLYMNVSTNGGYSWRGNDIRVTPETRFPDEFHLAAAGSRVYAMWWDFYGSADVDVKFNYSHDAGNTWPGGVQTLNHNTTGQTSKPRMAVNGASVYVVWYHQYSGININWSNNYGATWQTADTLVSSGGMSPEIAAAGSLLYVSYVYNDTMYLTVATQGPAAWSAGHVIRPFGVQDFEDINLFAANTDVYAAWTDQRCADKSVYFNYAVNRGDNFWPNPTPLNDTACSSASANNTVMTISGNKIFVAWNELNVATVMVNVGTINPIVAPTFNWAPFIPVVSRRPPP